MKNCVLFLLCFLPLSVFGQTLQADLLQSWDDETIVESFFANPYHDVWGAVVGGKEYGIICSTDGFHFFDLNDHSGEPVAYAAGHAQGGGIGHRDVKTYLNYMYGVADEGPSALQIVDMSNLPASVEQVYASDEFLRRCHNIFIDEDHGRLYAVGGNGFNVKVLSLANPEVPVELASFPNSNLNIPYVHDLYVRDHIAYLNAGSDGLIVVDFTDPENATILGSMTTYTQQGYNHSGWLTENGDHLIMCDETHGKDIKIVDVRDHGNMEVITTMNAESTNNQIPHNVMVQGNLVYASYYYDGLQVFDISDVNFPRRIGYYDTFDGPNNSYFAGAWGAFVMPSGQVVVSDMNTGFYHFDKVEIPSNTSLLPSVTEFITCEESEYEFTLLIGDGFDDNGVSLMVASMPPGISVALSDPTPMPGQSVDVTLITEDGTAGEFDMVISAGDGVNNSETTIAVEVKSVPTSTTLIGPGDEAEGLSPTFIVFSWTFDPIATQAKLDLSTNENDFVNDLVYSTAVTATSHILPIDLEEGTDYFWRIVSANNCGERATDVFSFTTEGTTSVDDLDTHAFQLQPNPASDLVQLIFNESLDQDLRLEWLSTNGQLLRAEQQKGVGQQLSLSVADLAEGLYFLRLSTADASVTRRILVQR